jgi:hypothetical protein
MLQDLLALAVDDAVVVVLTGAVLWAVVGTAIASWGGLSPALGAALGALLGPVAPVVLVIWSVARRRSLPPPRALVAGNDVIVLPPAVESPGVGSAVTMASDSTESWWGESTSVTSSALSRLDDPSTRPIQAVGFTEPAFSVWQPEHTYGLRWLVAAPAVLCAALIIASTQAVWLSVTPADVALGDLRGDSSSLIFLLLVAAGLTIAVAGLLHAQRPRRSWSALVALSSAPWVVVGAAMSMTAATFTRVTTRLVDGFDVPAEVTMRAGYGAYLVLAGGVIGMSWSVFACAQAVRRFDE